MLAWITAAQQQHQRAATLLGAVDAIWTDLGMPITSHPFMVSDHNKCERNLHDSLGEIAFTDVFHYGGALTYADTISYALEEPRQQAAPTLVPGSAPLTSRQRQVAELVAQGLSNKEVAAQLVISPRTADCHVEDILTKLGFTSRGQVAARLAAQSTSSAQGS